MAKQQVITTNTFNILPSRLEFFERRMEAVKKAADARRPKIPFKWTDPTKIVAIQIPLDARLIPRAKANLLPDVRQLSNGDWVRDVLPVTVEYGELTDAGFEYIGEIGYAVLKDTATGTTKTGFFPKVVKELGLTDAEYEKRVAEIAPQLEALASKFHSYSDLNCDHCSKTGDLKPRHSVKIVRATKDQSRWGKNNKFKMNLKKGDILQIGSKCMQRYSGINVKTLAAFYELDRKPVSASGPNGSPQNPAGWGYKEMGVWDFAERMVQYYNAREKDWLAGRRMSLWELESPNVIYDKGTLAPLIRREGKKFSKREIKDEWGKVIRTEKYEEGCFVERKGGAIMKGREFDMHEKDPSKEAKWMFQPFKGQGSVEDMREMWETGINESRQYITVPVVNEMDGSLVIDPATGDIMEIEEPIPSTEYIEKMIRKDWKLKIVPIFPPATDSKYVKRTLNRMMDWITNLKPSGKYADMQIRLQQTIELGYVGEKTLSANKTVDFTELWRMFMFADFERRKKADKKGLTKQFQKIGSDVLSAKYPDSKWYAFDKNDESYLVDYITTIYGGTVSRYSSYYGNRGDIAKAFSYKFQTVFLTPTEWAEFPVWMDAKKKKEAQDRAEREAANKYNSAVNTIYRGQFNQWPRPIMRKIPYDAPIDEFLAFMGWDSVNDPARYNHATSLFHISGSDIAVALLTEPQLDKVMEKFRPQIIGQSQPTPPAPTPHTPVAPTPVAPIPTATPSSMGSRITQAEAKRKAYAARKTSTYQGSIGTLLPLVEGWVTWISRSFGMRPDFKQQGRSIQIIDMQGNCFVVFHPTSSANQPRIGNWYNLFDMEVSQHNEYNTLEQTIITDPTGRDNTDFVDATNP